MELIETRNGIDLYFEALPEDTPIEDTFDDTCQDVNQIYEDINSGKYEYFLAHVVAMKNGIQLGEDYLGACLYNSTDEFIKLTDGYITDMKDIAYMEAVNNIQLLTVGAAI